MADIWNKYADTAARKHGKPGRDVRPKSTTIDAHTHIAVPRAAEFIKPHLDVSTIPLAHFASAETKAINTKQEADIRSCMTGYDERFATMDKMGVDVQLVMPPPPQCYTVLDLARRSPRPGGPRRAPGPAGAGSGTRRSCVWARRRSAVNRPEC